MAVVKDGNEDVQVALAILIVTPLAFDDIGGVNPSVLGGHAQGDGLAALIVPRTASCLAELDDFIDGTYTCFVDGCPVLVGCVRRLE